MQETLSDHVFSRVIIWHHETWERHSPKNVYIHGLELSLCDSVLSPALCAEQRSVSKKNKQYPGIPESQMEKTSCLPSNQSACLDINDQYQGGYYTLLVYFNCRLKPQGSQNEVCERQAVDDPQATRNHIHLFISPSCVQPTKYEN